VVKTKHKPNNLWLANCGWKPNRPLIFAPEILAGIAQKVAVTVTVKSMRVVMRGSGYGKYLTWE
jgi:hypothetical protein